MRIFAIDDERAMLEELHEAIAQAAPGADVLDFTTASELLEALRQDPPDVVFSDIRLPGMDGLNLAARIKQEAPRAMVIFVTAHPQYTMEAYRRHVNGYVLKPVTAEKIREELEALSLLQAVQPEPSPKLQIRCFGHFDVFWEGKPLIFQRTKTKELLAYLVDREGAACSSGEIALALWEQESDGKAEKNRIRVLINDLRTTLQRIGMEEVLIRERRQLALRCELVDCDYYRMRDGDIAAVNAYTGEYMKQYSWAELTTARLYFRQP